ncbi:TraB/GumN family protein [Polluticaenibacter yanchengensis]|uniref:TraB/GumN family protein n=1 Tax=Polluticaenibacter yanchengensis TaxID=3014562 RepID=A0ABT4UKW1_9BACT|nr:TraB/GumN family protein [Chitinophagaceae bacterium LY-5]
MIRVLIATLFLGLGFGTVNSFAQNNTKKYQSLLWQITDAKGHKSYLFGTMHVSDKMVFNLDDNFYDALKSVQTVALEFDPSSWEPFYAKNDPKYLPFRGLAQYNPYAEADFEKYMHQSQFALINYEKFIGYALGLKPSNINSFLYRNSSFTDKMDYEENTYLDLHIYQAGRKLNKKIFGLENMETSEEMVEKARLSNFKDKSVVRWDYKSMPNIGYSLQEAYRKQDLDQLDSIQELSSKKQYRQIFLIDRNIIQAASIDSIIKKGNTVFAAVGAAHLPGEFGVIEELRRKGYTLTPVKIRPFNSTFKNKLDSLYTNPVLNTVSTTDHFITTTMPGQWYNLTNNDVYLQYTDMQNGAFYSLYRLVTSAVFYNQTPEQVLEKVDSLSYEHIPGKIVSKKDIVINGYPGFDVTTKLSRGDLQRLFIIATPVELIVAKLSGNPNYVENSDAAKAFFGNFRINGRAKLSQPYQPAWGGFSVKLPHEPWIIEKLSAARSIVPSSYNAYDSATNTAYSITKVIMPRAYLCEEDTFELNLMRESYESSKNFDKLLSKSNLKIGGYHAQLANFKLKENLHSQVLFLIHGNSYYSIVAQRKAAFKKTMDPVLASFKIEPFKYGPATLQGNEDYGFTVKSNLELPYNNLKSSLGKFEDAGYDKAYESTVAVDYFKNFRTYRLRNDSTGEAFNIATYIFPEYIRLKDSADLYENFIAEYENDEDDPLIILKNTKSKEGDWEIWHKVYTQKNSTRILRKKVWYNKDKVYLITQYTDSVSAPSELAKNIFESFKPYEANSGSDIYAYKGKLFSNNITSKDSVVYKKALDRINFIDFTKEDLPVLKQFIDTLSWSSKEYLDIKLNTINAIGSINNKESVELLKALYEKAGDTAQFQIGVLKALLNQKNETSFNAFQELMTLNPPISLDEENSRKLYGGYGFNVKSYAEGLNKRVRDENYVSRNETAISALYDTLALTEKIMPKLMDLIDLEDYKSDINQLLISLADSNLLSLDLVKPHANKYLLEINQSIKKAFAEERNFAINKKTNELDEFYEEDEEEKAVEDQTLSYKIDEGSIINNFKLLKPFFNTNPLIKEYFTKALTIENKQLKFNLVSNFHKSFPDAVPDSMYQFFAKDLKYRSNLYEQLLEDTSLNKFPKQYAKPNLIAESILTESFRSKPDTFVLVLQQQHTLDNVKGNIYAYKYKENKNNSLWRWAVVGLLPNDTMEIKRKLRVTNKDLGKVDLEKNEKEEAARLIQQAINSRKYYAQYFYYKNENEMDY